MSQSMSASFFAEPCHKSIITRDFINIKLNFNSIYWSQEIPLQKSSMILVTRVATSF